MDSLYSDEEVESSASKLIRQAISFFVHTALALGSWLALMMVGYALNPPNVPQPLILLLSILIPLAVGFAVTRFRQDDMTTVVWLVGLSG